MKLNYILMLVIQLVLMVVTFRISGSAAVSVTATVAAAIPWILVLSRAEPSQTPVIMKETGQDSHLVPAVKAVPCLILRYPLKSRE